MVPQPTVCKVDACDALVLTVPPIRLVSGWQSCCLQPRVCLCAVTRCQQGVAPGVSREKAAEQLPDDKAASTFPPQSQVLPPQLQDVLRRPGPAISGQQWLRPRRMCCSGAVC